MAFVGVKWIGQGKMEFHADGSVTDVSEGRPMPDPSEPVPLPAPQKSLLEKAVETVEEVVKPKRRGRPKKKTDSTD